MKCFNCRKKGHPAKACPHKEKQAQSEPEMCGMTMQACCNSQSADKLHRFYEVCLDNGSQVNIINSQLLTSLRTQDKFFKSMGGISKTTCVGYLDGFYECQACDTCPTSILSLSDVEDIYPITYLQGKSFTAHMDDRDVIFTRRDKMYIADFSDWIVNNDQRREEVCAGLSLTTVSEREQLYSSKDVCKALEAGEFLHAMGYPSEAEAIHLVSDGNVSNIPNAVCDVKRFYNIYRPQVPGLRGRTAKKDARRQATPDSVSKMQIMNQELVADVMHVAKEKFLVSISSPLELLLVYHLKTQSAQELGHALQQHVNTLSSRGFKAKRVLVDPHSTLVSLRGGFPGAEIDPVGAGNHLDKLDTKIRQLKELIRSVIPGLPYKLPTEQVKDLVTYAVSCMNLCSTDGFNTNVCPRVRFTGYRLTYKSELGLSFGDYVELYDPKAHKRSNDVLKP